MSDEDFHDANSVDDICSSYSAFRPPRRVTVSQGAATNLVIKQPGGYVGNWAADETPYMVEPMDMLASRRHEAVCFVGPARTGKTMGLLEGWASHVIVNDPGDMLIVQMTQDKAREYSKIRIGRALLHSPNLAALKSMSTQDDNTHDKMFRNGMWLRIGWPTVSQLSSSDYRYVALTDYDRMPDDIDGEGSAFALGLKRTTTFLSRGMCVVESSPGRDVSDPNWKAVTPHEGPPADGVVSVYNRSDRRRWYWKCLDCADWYEAAPGIGLFSLMPPQKQLLDIVREGDLYEMAKQWSKVVCPHCGSISEKERKHTMNRAGRWLQDGQTIDSDDVVRGTPMQSTIAGYWMGGIAAAYQSWQSLVMRYLQGLREYAMSGSELTLKTTVNTDQCLPYMSMHLQESADANNDPIDRAERELERYVLPDSTRFVTAQVDVQGGSGARFIVQVQAHGPNFETWLVDRYEITQSKREGMGADFAPIDPASYAEDWDILTEKIVRSTYRTTTPGLELRMRMVAVDSGGEDGVTDKAYAWFRRLRAEKLHKRVMLVKGASAKGAAIIKETWVGNRSGREKGDVPLYLLNTNLLKDAVFAGINRKTPGPGYHHFPKPKGPDNREGWLPASFFDELQSEVRDKKGVWQQIRKRNESVDLCCYARAACLRLGVDKIKDWTQAPTWARPIAMNSDAITVEARREMKADERIAVAPVPSAPQRLRRVRRSAASSYLR
jgi:phage terminase large subunit GpA-like protein